MQRQEEEERNFRLLQRQEEEERNFRLLQRQEEEERNKPPIRPQQQGYFGSFLQSARKALGFWK